MFKNIVYTKDPIIQQTTLHILAYHLSWRFWESTKMTTNKNKKRLTDKIKLIVLTIANWYKIQPRSYIIKKKLIVVWVWIFSVIVIAKNSYNKFIQKKENIATGLLCTPPHPQTHIDEEAAKVHPLVISACKASIYDMKTDYNLIPMLGLLASQTVRFQAESLFFLSLPPTNTKE